MPALGVLLEGGGGLADGVFFGGGGWGSRVAVQWVFIFHGLGFCSGVRGFEFRGLGFGFRVLMIGGWGGPEALRYSPHKSGVGV